MCNTSLDIKNTISRSGLHRFCIWMCGPGVWGSETPGELDLDGSLGAGVLPALIELPDLIVVVHEEEITVRVECPADAVIRVHLTTLGIVLGEAGELEIR